MVGTQITRFLIKMNHKISHLKGFQGTIPDESGAQTSIQCTRTLCLPPTTFLFMWSWNKICFVVVVGTQKNMISGKKWTQNILFERIADNNTR